MVSKKKKSSKLGHDPLAWISEDDLNEIRQEHHEDEIIEESEAIASVEDEEQIDTKEGKLVEDTVDASPVEDEITEVKAMLDLPVYFGIAQVAEVHVQMQDMLKNDGEQIEINAEDIESIDAAAIQLLIAFVLKARKLNKEVVWKGVSIRLQDAADVFQIKDQLGLAA